MNSTHQLYTTKCCLTISMGKSETMKKTSLGTEFRKGETLEWMNYKITNLITDFKSNWKSKRKGPHIKKQSSYTSG